MITIIFFYVSATLIILFIFTTGFHDESNLIATIITSRSLNIYLIFFLSSISQFAGTLFLGTKVAYSMMNNSFNLPYILANKQYSEDLYLMVCAAMIAAIVWNIVTWVFGIPSSSSHAIIGSLIGAFAVRFGLRAINSYGLILNVLLPLFTSPLIGYLIGFLFLKINKWVFRNANAKVSRFFKVSQLFTCVVINAFQGSNDAQKGMGVLAFLFMLKLHMRNLYIGECFIFYSALAISLGLICGGFKMIRNVGTKIYRVRSIHSVSAQFSSLIIIILASVLGFPISGTQIINSATLGVGAADRPNSVGWEYAKNMLTGWVITIPASALIAILFYSILSLIYYGGMV